jgi:hypothetical protein
MTEVSHDEALRVLADLTLIRASTGSKLEIRIGEDDPRWPRTWELFEDGEREKEKVVRKVVALSGLAEAQAGKTRCDECRGSFQVGDPVLGKVVSVVFGATVGGFFSPTCVPCFASGRGGYLELVLALLVMET